MLDGAAAFETVDWLEHKAPRLDQPWLLVCSLVNPHDVMFLQTDPIETPHPNGAMAGLQTTVQRLGWFQKRWDVTLPDNFADDYALQPYGVRHYKESIDRNYGRIPDDRTDLWLERRNYLINACGWWTRSSRRCSTRWTGSICGETRWSSSPSDHGEMNGAHRMTQKGAIHFDEAAVVNLTVCVPGGPQGQRTRGRRLAPGPRADAARVRRAERRGDPRALSAP